MKDLKYGYLKITANEEYVDIFLGGKLVGQIQGESPFNKKVETGEHMIMVKKQYFVPSTIKVHISENDVFAYHFELVKAEGWREDAPGEGTVIQAKGNLTIVTERSDLVVYIEGIEKTPPFALKDMPAGIYSIRVKGGALDETFKITVNDGQSVFIDLDKKFPR